jgi:group I intron endonuclease
MNKKYKNSKNGIVYIYTSPIGKQYVGQTWYEERRKIAHTKAKGRCPAFHLAVKKYGYDNFQYAVLHKDIKTQEEMDQLEMQEIAIHNTISPNGYNLSTGGSSGRMCAEARKKISDARMGMQFTDEHRANLRKAKEFVSPETRQKMRDKKLGRTLSLEQRTKISKSNTGKHMSSEAIRKSAESRRGIKLSPERIEKMRITSTGRVHSEESKRKLSEKLKGRKMPPSHEWNMHLARQKYVKCTELNLIFDSATTAVRVLGGSVGAIQQAAAGSIKTSGGYHWEYME